MNDTIYANIEEILVGTFGVPASDVRADATIESLDLDSLDVVELTLIIEEETGVRIEDDEVDDIVTVRDAVDLVAARSDDAGTETVPA